LRAPKVADLLADRIRERILSGSLADGDRLPAQDDLLNEYGVGRSSLREALRVLESEGLISVQRGNVGGAVVHRPSPETAAYTLGMVLQSRDVRLLDVGKALELIEPLCAELCAGRDDRHETVVPQLQEAHDAAVAEMDDDLAVIRHSRRFHELLAQSCGNDTLTLVAGALESLWSVHEQAWAEDASRQGLFPEESLRTRGLREHGRLIKAIDRGDTVAAVREARKHLHTSQLYAMSSGADPRVRITHPPD
jgi:DNA-binding FadR family transcriptional regulator